MSRISLTPKGMVRLVEPSKYKPRGRVMPPSEFPATSIDLENNLRPDPVYGIFPVKLPKWSNQLVLRFSRPKDSILSDDVMDMTTMDDDDEMFSIPDEPTRSEAQWFDWLDRHHLGLEYYGLYEFSVVESNQSHRAMLLERIQGEHIALASNATDFRPSSSDAKKIQSWWNDQSRQDWQRIRGALLAVGMTPADLQFEFTDQGRIVIVDPELFELAPHVKPNNPYVVMVLQQIEEPLSTLVDIR